MEKRQNYNSTKYNPDFAFEGKFIRIIHTGFEEFEKLFGNKYDLSLYTIEIREEEKDVKYWVISFIPKVETNIQGIPYEVPTDGEWINGPGVSFSFSKKDLTLLQTIHMR